MNAHISFAVVGAHQQELARAADAARNTSALISNRPAARSQRLQRLVGFVRLTPRLVG